MSETRENRVSDFLNALISNHESDSISERMEEEAEPVELTLGLSLNGRFGVDPKGTKLARTTSIPEYMNPTTPVDSSAVVKQVFPVAGSEGLMRTCSLPVEPEEEVRKRKEMQSLRRMEARRKRIEKQRKLGLRESGERKRVVPIPVKIEKRVEKGLCLEKIRKYLQEQVAMSSQGSTSDSESQVIGGTSQNGTEVRSVDQNGHTNSDQMKLGPSMEMSLLRTVSLGTGMKNQFNKLTVSDNSNHDGTRESFVRNAMMDMPCVSTQGDGPEGKRIEGLLYRYNQGEEVRIICVCHGKFLSPAEFVKHAGGTDVEQPLKHIVVAPSSTFH